jgi:dienelactone hydrolase
MTANAYVPSRPGKHPGVLIVHGHWKGAKQDPVVQSRCQGLVKLGFFVLAVDAFGGGERGIGKALGEYHGEMIGAALWPTGLALSGLQVYENMRAIDYMQSRPECDGARLGVTGASGGGNQSMYIGAYDERLSAVVPVCSVGRYQAYLGTACCNCEVVPNAIAHLEEWAVLALTVPRALLVINATKDAVQFSVEEATKSLALTRKVYEAFAAGDSLKHAPFESFHDYNQPMRELMYGWMTRHLKGEGTGDPIPEPELQLEEPETLRCFPGDSRPEDFVTLPKFTAAKGREIVSALRRPPMTHREQWSATAEMRRRRMRTRWVPADVIWPGEMRPPEIRPMQATEIPPMQAAEKPLAWMIVSEPGIEVQLKQHGLAGSAGPATVWIDLAGSAVVEQSDEFTQAKEQAAPVFTVDLRATGRYQHGGDKIGRAPDHNTAQWGCWLGYPLLGQWLVDLAAIRTAITTVAPKVTEVSLRGMGAGAFLALVAGASDPRWAGVVVSDCLATLVNETPLEKFRMGLLAHGLLNDVGDVADIAALIAPRPVAVLSAADSAGNRLSAADVAAAFEQTTWLYKLIGSPGAFTLPGA